MKLISENLHIISKSIKEAILNKDKVFIKNLLERQLKTNPDWIDLNIGPAKRNFEGTMNWLTNILTNMSDISISFDSTNAKEIKDGLKLVKNPENCIINSASADNERLEIMTDLAAKYNTYLIALTLNNEIGIPKEADGRLELAFSVIEKTQEKGIDNSKILFDPLILPVGVDQTQAGQALDTIRMFKESFDPPVLTTIGLSNVSNGTPKELRPLINEVFFVMAAGCGLDTAIVDSFDDELIRLNNLLDAQTPQKSGDDLILRLYQAMQNFEDIEDISYDKNNSDEVKIYKTAEILLNKKIYSHSYLEI